MSILGPGLIRHRSVQPFFSKCFACLVGRAYFILSNLRKNIKLKLVLNNAVLKRWKAAIRYCSENDKDRWGSRVGLC